MRLFYHHVGVAGAEADFPKTVYSRVPHSRVADAIADRPSATGIIADLRNAFPSGSSNCWGVPAGAQSVIRHLSPGDTVLLVESTRGDGAIPALGIVKVYPREELPDLSSALWGDVRFPYVFFFETEQD
jgi:5-methylcytosine-specific restriction enzyme A